GETAGRRDGQVGRARDFEIDPLPALTRLGLLEVEVRSPGDLAVLALEADGKEHDRRAIRPETPGADLPGASAGLVLDGRMAGGGLQGDHADGVVRWQRLE